MNETKYENNRYVNDSLHQIARHVMFHYLGLHAKNYKLFAFFTEKVSLELYFNYSINFIKKNFSLTLPKIAFDYYNTI